MTEINPLVKIFNEAVIKGQARQKRCTDKCKGQHGKHQRFAFGNHQIGQPFHGAALFIDHITGIHRHYGQQGREQGHRQNPGINGADTGKISEVTIGRRIREVKRKQADGGCDGGQENRLRIDFQAFDNGLFFLHTLAL